MNTNLKVLTWNVRRAIIKSQAWTIILDFDPDVALLQEVGSIPDLIKDNYFILCKKATNKNGKFQQFGTAVLSKYPIDASLRLVSEIEWINEEIKCFSGNLVCCKINVSKYLKINLISVYSPAWRIEPEKYEGKDVSGIKLENSADLWVTELLWIGLQSTIKKEKGEWIVAGDFNSSVTFDYLWGTKPRGNQEIIDRFYSLGLKECLAESNKKLVPTFKSPRGGKIIHQIDHIYASKILYNALISSNVENKIRIFEDSVSDHLPIMTEFDIRL